MPKRKDGTGVITHITCSDAEYEQLKLMAFKYFGGNFSLTTRMALDVLFEMFRKHEIGELDKLYSELPGEHRTPEETKKVIKKAKAILNPPKKEQKLDK